MDTNGSAVFKTVTLRNGKTVSFRYVPPFLASKIAGKIPDPDPPVIIIPSKLPGVKPSEEYNFQDPTYIKARLDSIRRRAELLNEFAWNYSIVGIEPPEDDEWKTKLDIIEYDPDFVWREGRIGRRLDWIQYVLLANPNDLGTVQKIVNEASSSFDEEEVTEAEDTFRDSDKRKESTGRNRKGSRT